MVLFSSLHDLKGEITLLSSNKRSSSFSRPRSRFLPTCLTSSTPPLSAHLPAPPAHYAGRFAAPCFSEHTTSADSCHNMNLQYFCPNSYSSRKKMWVTFGMLLLIVPIRHAWFPLKFLCVFVVISLYVYSPQFIQPWRVGTMFYSSFFSSELS